MKCTCGTSKVLVKYQGESVSTRTSPAGPRRQESVFLTFVDHLLADDAKDDGCGVVLPHGLQPYSSSYVSPFPHAILVNRVDADVNVTLMIFWRRVS